MLAVLQYVVDNAVISEDEEDIPTHTAGYPERVAVKNHPIGRGHSAMLMSQYHDHVILITIYRHGNVTNSATES